MTPRQLTILVMGFASGLPLLLTLSTLTYWLATVGVDKTTIGLFALVGIPYNYKFALAPLIDQIRLPIIGRFGRRKSWLFVLQLGLAAAIFAMGQTDPVNNLTATAIVTLIMAVFAASQDIVVDAYRIEILGAEEQGAGAGTTQVGYRLGMLLAGAGAFAMADFLPWSTVFAVLAAAILLCALFTLFVREPARAPRSTRRRSFREWLDEAVIQPFGDFMTRRGWVVILLFILFYKFGDAFGGFMASVFYQELGFTGTEIGAISKVYGLIATLVGGVLGGLIVARFGVFKTLLVGGILQAITNLLFSVLALMGNDLLWLGIAITADNLAGGVASAAFVAYLSSLCNVAYTATQYALLTSLMAFGRTVLSSGSGWLSDHLDWFTFWASTTFMAVPGLLLLMWIARLYPQGLTSRPR
ncbi:MAG: MFS transporter [Rhodospirillaceae bacterium]|nr:MFS transporter [Rhodospirillaceae bacterium]